MNYLYEKTAIFYSEVNMSWERFGKILRKVGFLKQRMSKGFLMHPTRC